MRELPLTVFNPTPGGGESAPVTLTVYASISLSGSALTYDPFGQRLFASIPASAASHANSVAIIDPSSANVLSYISVGNDPHRMAVSDDGKYLYVGLNGNHAVQRINLTSGLIEKTLALPVDPTYGQLIVADIKAVPGAPKSFVAALFRVAVSPPEEGIALFNDTGLVSGPLNPLPNGIGAVDNFVLAGNPPNIYSMPPLGVFTFDAGGLHPQQPETIPGTIQQIGLTAATDGTLIYTSAGVVWNPTTQTVVGNYNPPLLNAAGVVPDTSEGRTFFLNPTSQNVEGGATSVEAYDQASFAFAGFVGFPALPGVDVVELTRWGTDGFAFLVGDFVNAQGTDQLILFRSSIAHASTGQNPAPVLTALGTSSVAGGSPNFTLNVMGSSFVQGSVVDWNGTARTTTYVNATQLTADIPASDVAQAGSAQIIVVNPAPGGGTSAALVLAIGPPPAVTLNPSSLTFSSQSVKATSIVQTVTLTNSGGAALLFDGFQASGDFAATNNCGASLAPLASCTISVNFTPSLIGSRQGSVAIYDNVGGSPQMVMLSGAGTAPTFSFATGGSVVTAATVAPGQTAAYSLSMAADTAYSGTVTLSCAQVPMNAHCTVNPGSLVLKNGSSASFAVSVSTGSSTAASLAVRWPLTSAACGFVWLLFFRRKTSLSGVRPTRVTSIVAVMLTIVVVMAGCGGGSSATPTPPVLLTTPAGTYTLQIVASDGTTSHTQAIQLVVQ
jgi:hypothetical protein